MEPYKGPQLGECSGAGGGSRNPNLHWKRLAWFWSAGAMGLLSLQCCVGCQSGGTGMSCLHHGHPGLLCSPTARVSESRQQEKGISSYPRSNEWYHRQGEQAVKSGWEQTPYIFLCLSFNNWYLQWSPNPPSKQMTWFHQERVAKHQW